MSNLLRSVVKAMPRPREGLTYRVRNLQVLPSVAFQELSSVIASLSPGFGPADNIQIHSVASSPVAYENPPTSVATVTFSKTPPLLDNEKVEWFLSARHLDWGRRNVIFDTHFLGFTVLNEPEPSSHAFDCIAISGLGSHPFGSWKSRRPGSDFMWLRDGLPVDVPSMRTIIYGYDTTLNDSESFQTVQDIAISFVSRLAVAGRSSPSAKPIIFLAHSLGGIVLKHALLEMANSEPRRHIFEAVRAVVFFGVPHKGMQISHLRSMVDGQPNGTLVQDLGSESTYLRVLDVQFSGLAYQSVRVFSVFETKRSPTVQKSADGRWHRDGPPETVVTRDSAIHKCSDAPDIICIDQNHSNLVKIAEGDTDYACILHFLQDIAPNARQSAISRDDNNTQLRNGSFPRVIDSRQWQISELLEGLRTDDMHARLSDIAPPYESTFKWIWTANDLDFVSWLQYGIGIYWISGKPGSGKSTLMKYIYRNQQTEMHLSSGHCSTKPIRPNFFFHNRGSKNQKSLEGLLRSLLHQLLSSESRLMDTLLDSFRTRPRERRSVWSRQNLEETLALILAQTSTDVSICLFLDALDEYDGDPESVAQFLRSIVEVRRNSATKIKVCFSSRLYNVFIDEFGGCPGFKIHERTQMDIKQVVDGQMSRSQSITKTLASGDETTQRQLEELKNEIVSRAQGVFLWLRLALDNLIRAHREGGTMTDILRHLSVFPDELDRFYQLIIEDILPEHRRETYVMLEAVLRYNGELTAEGLFGVIICSSLKTLKETPQTLSFPLTVDSADSQFARRLRSRCGGLLELEAREGSASIVHFMHHTVQEFVSQPGFRQLVVPNERYLPMENGHSFLSKYGLCRLYHARDDRAGMTSIQPFLNHTTEVELTTGRSQKRLIDEIPPVRFALGATEPIDITALVPWTSARLDTTRARNLGEIKFNSPTSFAVSRNLRLYISETLQISGNQFVNQNPGRSLLHFAVKPETRRLAYHPESLDSLDMVQILLKAGAKTKTVCEENHFTTLTPFQAMFFGLDRFPAALPPMYEIEDFTKMTRYFLDMGEQNPNESVKFEHIIHDGAFVYAGSLKALHVSSGALTALLLRHGAEANAEDGLGRRPLDLIIQIFNSLFRGLAGRTGRAPNRASRQDFRLPGEAYETVTQLLAHGGRFTRSTVGEDSIRSLDGKKLLCAFEYFIDVLENAGYDGNSLRREFLRLKEEEETTRHNQS